jgi:hypothetical protein
MKLHRYLIAFMLGLSILVSGCGKSEEEYKKAAVAINYDEFERKPESYKGQTILLANTINNVKENGKEVELLIGDKIPILAHYTLKDKEEKLVENETVRIWGEFKKVSTKKITDTMPETSVIEMDVKYISLPVWTFLVGRRGHNNWTTEKNGEVNPLDSESMQLSLSGGKINADNIDIKGIIALKGAYFHFKGSINDNGIGEFEYNDQKENSIGVKGKIKINNKNEIEIETPNIEQERSDDLPDSDTSEDKSTVKIENGTYILKRK